MYFLSPALLFADYGWPLDQNYGISATFGESRIDHYHAGIDISTNGKTGLAVHSIDDGKVIRMRITKRGYGRALYILHADGVVSVYGHLDHYSTDLGLEQLYQKVVAQRETKYPGDIMVDPAIAVHKGDVVAFSGETGAGLPHLHLELRREDSVAVNPLLNGFHDIQDDVPPVIQSFFLYPSDARTTIDGRLQTTEISLTRQDDGSYTSQQIPQVTGDFLVAASAYDPTYRPYRRAPEKYAFSVDGRALYSLEFTRFSYNEPAHFGVVYDQSNPGPSYYESPVRLGNSYGAKLPFAVTANPVSIGSLSGGTHELQLTVSDAAGNSSMARVSFMISKSPETMQAAASGAGLTGDLTVEPYGNGLELNFESSAPQSAPIVASAGQNQYTMMQTGPTSYRAIVPAPKIRGTFAVTVGASNLTVPVQYIPAGNATQVEGSNFAINLAADSLYTDSYIWTRSVGPYQAETLPLVGSAVQIGPRGLPLNQKATLTFKYPESFAHPEKLSIYYWDHSGERWVSMPAPVDQSSPTVSASITYLDLYALIYDNVPPTISPLFPRKGSRTSNRTPKLSAFVWDAGMLIDDDRMRFFVDGVAHTPDYDPDRNLATFTMTSPLSKGTHSLRIVAYDYGGNKTESPHIYFTVR
ncbi:MAG TPA: peptidoglycan DD-metalloendopeptidase family protein [Acidobacteriota bacterium]|nr:peptidoglycan DD-metalloendopeptidase family protein [Acidobacteriota bacterium]